MKTFIILAGLCSEADWYESKNTWSETLKIGFLVAQPTKETCTDFWIISHI